MVKHADPPAQAGQSLIEIIIALTVFTMVVTAAAMVFYGGSSAVRTQGSSAAALEYARSGLEAARAIRDQLGCGSIANGTYGVVLQGNAWQLTPSPDTSGELTRTITVSTLDTDTKKIVASVSWASDTGGLQSIQLTEALSDWQAVASDIGTPSGDWAHPRIAASIDIGPGNEGTGLAYQNKKIYMSGSASSVGKPDLFIFDVTNPFAPSLQGSLNVEEAWAAVAVSGSYAYGIEQASSDFFTVRISNPAIPVKTGKVTLSGGNGTSVATKGTYAFVGTTQNASGAEFFVVDISNAAAPTQVATLEIGSDVNVVTIRGTKAYITTSFSNGEMKIIDITTPTTPVIVGTFDAPGTGQPGTSAYATLCGYAYLGRASGAQAEFYAVNTADPSNPSSLGSYDAAAQVNGMVTGGTYAFIGTDDTNQEFKVLDMTNLNSISLLGGLNLPQRATGLVYNNNFVYLSVKSNDAFKIITSIP